MKTSRCRSCRAEIVWVKTRAAKLMPLDAKPEKRWVLGEGDQSARLVDTYVSHYASCPDAETWRKRP
jgi:hypothetical protein